jgi:hypothetical protein
VSTVLLTKNNKWYFLHRSQRHDQLGFDNRSPMLTRSITLEDVLEVPKIGSVVCQYLYHEHKIVLRNVCRSFRAVVGLVKLGKLDVVHSCFPYTAVLEIVTMLSPGRQPCQQIGTPLHPS